MSVKNSRTGFKNFGDCVKLENDVVSLIITVDVGPRIISYCLNGKENMMYEDVNRNTVNSDSLIPDKFGNGASWYMYGGHRLWASPEHMPDTYFPDNHPVSYTMDGNSVTLTQVPQELNGRQLSFTVKLDENSSKVFLSHKITNIGDKVIELAPWTLEAMAVGGKEIIPWTKKNTGLLPSSRLVLWPYTNVQDPRFYLGNDYITLIGDGNAKSSFKIGINNETGWVCYLNKQQLFVKRFNFDENAAYPDYNVNYETYTCKNFLEIEAIGALVKLRPNESVEFDESWELLPCCDDFDERSDKSIGDFVNKYGIKK